MIRNRILIYGWHADGGFCLSEYPPDAPVRPHLRVETLDEVRAFAKRRRADIYWWPPLPDELNGTIENGLRLEGRG